MHLLDIDISDNNLNPRAFRIVDTSVYDANIPATNLILEITPPGSYNSTVVRVNKGFSKVLNANLLRLNAVPLKQLPSLPDGLYRIKFSAAPNELIWEEYNYFRNTKQVTQYMELWTDLINNENKYGRKYFNELKTLLWSYKQYIDGAKYLVQDRDKKKEGAELYSKMSDNLKKFKSLC